MKIGSPKPDKGSDDTESEWEKETEGDSTESTEDVKVQKVEKRRRSKKKLSFEGYPKLGARSSPTCLHSVVENLNDDQKRAVREMGFGHVLDMNITEMPSRLAYWVVDNFDVRCMEIKLLNGRMLAVTEDDVKRVYGFPEGNREIDLLRNHESNDVYEEWAKAFNIKDKGLLKTKDLVAALGECENDGLWFRQTFMILLAHCLIESRPSGYVFPYIIKCLANVDQLQQWNWSKYVLDSLIRRKISWMHNGKKMFSGPALFITLLYVDRVSVGCDRIRPRVSPTCLGWDYKSLNDRQELEMSVGGFGGGHVIPPLRDEDRDLSNAEKIDLLVNQLGDVKKKLKEMLAQVEDDAHTDENLRTAVTNAKAAIGEPSGASQHTPVHEGERDYWEQVVNISREVEAAASKNKGKEKLADIPSFRLDDADMDDGMPKETSVNVEKEKVINDNIKK